MNTRGLTKKLGDKLNFLSLTPVQKKKLRTVLGKLLKEAVKVGVAYGEAEMKKKRR